MSCRVDDHFKVLDISYVLPEYYQRLDTINCLNLVTTD